MPTRIGPIVLDYGNLLKDGLPPDKLGKLLKNLSGLAASSPTLYSKATLWTVSDEGRTLERRSWDGTGFTAASQFMLDKVLPTKIPDPSEEVDLESADIADGRASGCVARTVAARKARSVRAGTSCLLSPSLVAP